MQGAASGPLDKPTAEDAMKAAVTNKEHAQDPPRRAQSPPKDLKIFRPTWRAKGGQNEAKEGAKRAKREHKHGRGAAGQPNWPPGGEARDRFGSRFQAAFSLKSQKLHQKRHPENNAEKVSTHYTKMIGKALPKRSMN